MGLVIKTNVLLMGKSGVGKSSLLNYLFGQELQKTGIGGACTPPGVYPHSYTVDRDFMVDIYDSWGLEADKTIDWIRIIMTEIKEHDKKGLSEWFSTIFYCFSLDLGKVEEFELDILRHLKDTGNEVTVVITHCRDENEETQICRAMKERIETYTGIRKSNIICVNSVEKTLLGGRKICCFGREEVFTVMRKNIWLILWKKMPKILESMIETTFSIWEKENYHNVDKNVHWWSGSIEKISNEIEKSYCNMMKKLITSMNQKIIETNEYYCTLCSCFKKTTKWSGFEKIKIESRISVDIEKYYRPYIKKILGKKSGLQTGISELSKKGRDKIKTELYNVMLQIQISQI